VVWLDDERRERYLQSVQQLTRERQPRGNLSQIVFEGNAPADARKNEALSQMLQDSTWAKPPKSAVAWLGEAIAIKEPTAANFRAQSGANLLIVGQNEVAVLGILARRWSAWRRNIRRHGAGCRTCPLLRPRRRRGGFAHTEFFEKLAASLPHSLAVGRWRELAARWTAWPRKSIDGRKRMTLTPRRFLWSSTACSASATCGGRGRLWPRAADGRAASPAVQFAMLLREGPGVGVHTLLWCDSLNNLNRGLDRQSLREFEMRVLFQMGQNDSARSSTHAGEQARLAPGFLP